MQKRLTKLVLGQSVTRDISTSHILIVGAGGIGCELIKNLSKIGYKNMTLIDLDNIEITNLNRQFYFRKSHIGKSKAETVREVLLSLDSSLNIQAIHSSIYNEQLNSLFYEKFDIIFSCLDNMKAREYLAAQAIKNGKILIDAGTMSYYGQTYSSIRFRTNCHNCNPTHSQQVHASCTIRSHPQLPLHCATYAQNFYDTFFGVNQAEALSDNLKIGKYISDSTAQLSQERLHSIAVELFEEMFSIGITEIDLEGNKIDFVRKLSYLQALELKKKVINPMKSTFNKQEHLQHLQSLYKQQQLLSIAQYCEQIIQSVINLLKRKLKNDSPSKFQKDDEDCMNLILSIANLRTYNFINSDSEHNKHKYLTYYQCKDLIGRIFPAIASTNAIAAALQARQAINIISGQLDNIRYISFGNKGQERLSPSFQSSYNLECSVCSEKNVYGKIGCNLGKTTFRQLQQFTAQHFFTRERDVTSGSISIISNSRKKSHANKDKLLNFVPELIHNKVLQLKFNPELGQPQYRVQISVVHTEDLEQLHIIDNSSRKQVRNQLLRYFKKAREEYVSNHQFQFELNGGHEL